MVGGALSGSGRHRNFIMLECGLAESMLGLFGPLCRYRRARTFDSRCEILPQATHTRHVTFLHCFRRAHLFRWFIIALVQVFAAGGVKHTAIVGDVNDQAGRDSMRRLSELRTQLRLTKDCGASESKTPYRESCGGNRHHPDRTNTPEAGR